MATPAEVCALPSRLLFVRLTRLCAPCAAADSWEGATEEQERDLYKATFRLFQKGLGEALCSVLREKSHPHLLPYIGGNVPLNYYLKHNFNAPAPVPTNDLDIKVEFGEHMRAIRTAARRAHAEASLATAGRHSDARR